LGEESIAIAEAKTGFEQDDNGIWYAQFNYQGIPSEQRFLGRLTITSSQVNDIERCVSIATLLGAMQTGEIDCYSSQIASTGCDDGPSDDGLAMMGLAMMGLAMLVLAILVLAMPTIIE